MIPAYPPELGGRNCTPVQTLVYLETMASRRIPRSGALPRATRSSRRACSSSATTRSSALAPAAIRGDTIWCIGMSEPERGLRPRRPADARRGVRRPLRRERPEGVDVATRRSRRSASATCAPIPTSPKHKGISLLILDMDTPGIEMRPLRAHHGARPTSPRCSSPTSIVPRENLVGRAQRRVGDHARLTRARARRAVGRRRRRASNRRSTASSTLARAHGPQRRSGRAPQDRARPTSSRRACARSATRASRRSRRARSAPEHSYMKMATSEAGKAAYELGMEISGPYGAVTDDDRGRGPAAGSTASSCSSRTRSRAASSEIQRNIIAQRVLGPPPEPDRWTSPSPTTSSCCATPRASCSTRSARRRSCARTSTIPAAYRPAVAAPARVRRARPRAAHRPVPVLRGDAATSRRPDRSSPTALSRCSRTARPAKTATTGTVAIAGTDGDWTPNDDPVKTFVLEADRVDRIAIIGAGPTLLDRRRADAPRCASSRPSTSRVASFELDADAVGARPAAARAASARGVARPRLRRARGRDGRHRAPDLRR